MVADGWLKELPQQFHDKRKIEVLISAFARQIDELLAVFEQLRTETTLERAVGKNLDYVGDIMSLTRKDAQKILMVNNNTEITDEIYRKVLMYRALENTCDCTYYDIMESIKLLWDTDSIKYVEDPEKPANISIELPEASLDGMDPAIGRVLALRPGGVNMYYSTKYAEGVDIGGSEKVTASMIRILWWRLNGKVLLNGSKILDAERVEEAL